VRPAGVVVDPEVLGEHLSFEQGLEQLDVEQLVAQPPVEGLDGRCNSGVPLDDELLEVDPMQLLVGAQTHPEPTLVAPTHPPAVVI
jgi:hypothetical protein